MSATQITIRTNKSDKEAIAKFASKLGLSTSAFMMAAARDAIDNGKVVLRDPDSFTYSQEMIDTLLQIREEAREQYKRGEYYAANTPEESITLLKSWMDKSKNAR